MSTNDVARNAEEPGRSPISIRLALSVARKLTYLTGIPVVDITPTSPYAVTIDLGRRFLSDDVQKFWALLTKYTYSILLLSLRHDMECAPWLLVRDAMTRNA